MILSITPSETFDIEDGFELTLAERKEAEQMQKEERLRRRDPKAHTAMILERRERGTRPLQQYATLHNPPPTASVDPMTSTQQVRWDAPMIATGDMLRPPPAASNPILGGGIMLDAPTNANSSSVISPNPDQPQSGSLSPTITRAGKAASIPTSEQTQSGLVAPGRLIGTPKFTTQDLQNHIDNSVTFSPNNQVAQPEEALAKAIGDLFGEGPLERSLNHKGFVPKALRKATREEFQAMISRKCSENKYGHVDESLRPSYAHELRTFIVRKAKNEEEHRHLASGLKNLLDKQSINPKTLLKVLGDKLRTSKPDPCTDNAVGRQILPDHTVSGQLEEMDEQAERTSTAAEPESGFQKSGSGRVSSINGHRTGMNELMDGSTDSRGGRKRSAAADHEHPKKKVKSALAPTPNSSSPKTMERNFANLLRREAARATRGRR